MCQGDPDDGNEREGNSRKYHKALENESYRRLKLFCICSCGSCFIVPHLIGIEREDITGN
jgi:hypothetical protein